MQSYQSSDLGYKFQLFEKWKGKLTNHIFGRVRLKAGFYGTLCIKLESFKVKLTFEYIGQGKRNSILNLGYWNK